MMVVVQLNIIQPLVGVADLMRIIYHVDYPSWLSNNNGTDLKRIRDFLWLHYNPKPKLQRWWFQSTAADELFVEQIWMHGLVWEPWRAVYPDESLYFHFFNHGCLMKCRDRQTDRQVQELRIYSGTHSWWSGRPSNAMQQGLDRWMSQHMLWSGDCWGVSPKNINHNSPLSPQYVSHINCLHFY